MGFKCGIIGLPNVGKSTLFNALTQASIAAENYPFCTIEPNVGTVPVPDLRLDNIAKIVKPARQVPATMRFVDIAGLVAGASKGEGLGNQFLANIRETQAIAHVVRVFHDTEVTHVGGVVDPLADIETIQTELALADLEIVDKVLVRLSKAAKTGDKTALAEKALLERVRSLLNAGKALRSDAWEKAETTFLDTLQLLTLKPTFYIANVNENLLKHPALLEPIQELAAQENTIVVPICATLEADISTLDELDKADFLKEVGLKEPGLNRIIHAGYQLLGLQTYFTAGPKEVHAWTIPQGVTAPVAAGVIHSDFERGFIRAEVISYEDFIMYQGEQGARNAGKLRLEGKQYRVEEGDILHFRFNV